MELPTVLQLYSHELVAGALTAGGWLMSRLVNSRAKLYFYRNHAFTLLVDEPQKDENGKIVYSKQTVNTASLSFQNVSRFPARSVEIVFNWKPQFWNMALARGYSEEVLPDGRYVIKMADLAPKEVVDFELLSINGALPGMINFRSEDCVGEERQMHLVARYSNITNIALAAVFVLGIFYIVLLSINIIVNASGQ